ncbi:MAG: hypothetical protein O3B31_13810 [Chloroflexi bacterium]|nr:hypothetical protein [Chloroflexota bacterium]MDA1004398.1 hypothetical protein [Chloroflexota bacterium]
MSAEAAEAHIRDYVDAFTVSYAGNHPSAMRHSFRLPLTLVTPDGIRVIDSEDEYTRWAESVHEGLAAQRFTRTDATALSVLELSPVAAIVHLDFAWTNASGERSLRRVLVRGCE